MPIVRTFVPFVAGVAEMSYPSFAMYNVSGAIIWVGLGIGAGYVFGNVPIVKDNFSLVAIGIVIVSILPIVFEYIRYRRAPRRPSGSCGCRTPPRATARPGRRPRGGRRRP